MGPELDQLGRKQFSKNCIGKILRFWHKSNKSKNHEVMVKVSGSVIVGIISNLHLPIGHTDCSYITSVLTLAFFSIK